MLQAASKRIRRRQQALLTAWRQSCDNCTQATCQLRALQPDVAPPYIVVKALYARWALLESGWHCHVCLSRLLWTAVSNIHKA